MKCIVDSCAKESEEELVLCSEHLDELRGDFRDAVEKLQPWWYRLLKRIFE